MEKMRTTYKVCHISTVHSLFDDRIFFKECKSLQNAGFEVVLAIPHSKAEIIDYINIVPLIIPNGRLTRLFKGSLLAFRAALKSKATIIHFHDPELMGVGLLLKLAGKKIIYDVHEDLPKQILYKEWLKPTFLRHFLSFLILIFEKFCCLFFNSIIAVTEDIKNKYNPKKTILLRNLPIIKLLENIENKEIQKTKFTIIYTGGLSLIRGIKEILDAVAQLKGEVELWLLGSFESESYESACRNAEGWRYTKYFGQVKLNEVFAYTAKADVGISTLYPIKNYLTSLPVKAFEYMALEKPIIMSNFNYWKTIFAKCAIFVNPHATNEIAQAILTLKNNPELCASLGKLGKQRVSEELSWEKEQIKLIDLYKKLSNSAS